jgi:peptidoglycan/LPS O-acetylase OafA/YrhL
VAQSQRNNFGALLLIGLGVLFLIGQVFNINFWSIVGFSWPAFIIIPGVIFLALAFTGERKMAGLVFPGAIITGTGAILWFQNATNNWQSWAYVWTLYPVFVGLGLVFMGRRTDDQKTLDAGRGMVKFGTISFIVGAAFFELLIFNGNSALTTWMVPLALIVGGGYLLLSGRGVNGKLKRMNDVPLFTGARNMGIRSNGNGSGYISHGDDLQRRIDEAIAEDEPDDPKPLA